MAQLEEVKGKISFDANTKGIDDAKKKLHGFSEGTVAASKKVMLGVAAAGAAVVAFGVKSVGAYFDAQEAGTKLATNLLNVKGNTLENVESLDKMASALQSVGVVEDDVIKAGMSQLATFNLQGKTIETVTPKILDMATQMKGYNVTSEDMVGLNNLVGKVLTGNAGALTRYGVTLSENQKQLIEQGTESERAATLVEVLGQNYGKVNEALRKTPKGAIIGLKNDFGDLQEQVGETIVTAMLPLIEAFSRWMDKVNEAGGILAFLQKFFEDHAALVAGAAAALIGAMVPATWAWFAGLIAVDSALWPILAFMAVFALLGAGFMLLKKWFDGTSESAMWFKDKLAMIHDYFIANVLPVLKLVWTFIKDQFIRIWNDLRAAIEPHLPMLKQVAKVIGIVLLVAIGLIIAVIAICVLGWIAMIMVIMKVVTWVMKLITWFKNLAINVQIFIGNMIMGVVQYFRDLPGKVMDAIRGIGAGIGSVFQGAKDAVRDVLNGILQYFRELPGKIMSLVSGLGSRIGSAIGNIPIIGKLATNAQGTDNWRGGMTVVGEEGPEIVSLPRGSQIFSNSESRRMAQGGSGVTVNMNVEANNSYDWRAIAERVGYKVAMAR